jgi:3-deoxy-manno-octulosonate cytidylyltransferase (CMP-KDO synthetase)
VLPVPSLEHSVQLSSKVVIPARYESTRFPGKPLARLAGKPMIEHVYLRAREARGVSGVIVATDDERIAAAVRAFGGDAVMTLGSHATGTDRLAEVAARLECDVVVNVQGDEPLVAPEMIEQVIAPFAADAALQMTSLRTPIRAADDLEDPNVVKVVVDRNDFALYFSRAPIPWVRDHGATRAAVDAWRHIGLYGYRRTFLPQFAAMTPTRLELLERLEQLRALEHGIRIKVLPTTFEAIGVDTPADLARVEALMSAGIGSGGSRRAPHSDG